MAISNPKSLVLLGLWIAILSADCYADLITEVCSKSSLPSYCEDVLRSSGYRDPDLIALGKIAYSFAQDEANKVQALLQPLINEATDKELKHIFQVCSSDIDEALRKLSESNYYFHHKDYSKMRDPIIGEAFGVFGLEYLCDHHFVPSTEPPLLRTQYRRARGAASVVVAIANALLGH